jgi:hypothetical protein
MKREKLVAESGRPRRLASSYHASEHLGALLGGYVAGFRFLKQSGFGFSESCPEARLLSVGFGHLRQTDERPNRSIVLLLLNLAVKVFEAGIQQGRILRGGGRRGRRFGCGFRLWSGFL